MRQIRWIDIGYTCELTWGGVTFAGMVWKYKWHVPKAVYDHEGD